MMTDSQRLWRGLLIALFLHIGIVALLFFSGFLVPSPPAPQEEPAEVSMIDEAEPEIPLPREEAGTNFAENAESSGSDSVPPPLEPDKPKITPKYKQVIPQPPKEKPSLPDSNRKNLFDTDPNVEKAFIAPILDKRQEPLFPPGVQQPTQPFAAIDIIIGKDGHVDKAAVSISSGSPGVDQAALESIKRYVFIPGKDKLGKPIRCSFSITLIL